MITAYADMKELSKVLLSRKDYRPFPKYDDRDGWAKYVPNCAKDI